MAPWNPWRALRDRPVLLSFAEVEGARGLWERRGGTDHVVLDYRLDRRTRRVVLAHELIHAERGIGAPWASAATMQLEEERVWRTALARLAPPAEVAAFLERRGTVGPVHVVDLAEEFDLPLDAAERVAALLACAPAMRPAVSG